MDKTLVFQRQNTEIHWVGDGFPVRNLFSYNDLAAELSPFLLLDYAGPVQFDPTTQRRGVGEHPHRGFETVTIVFDGEVEHRDSSGAGGVVRPGDVQWMTAARGIVHEEFHGREYAKRGGPFEMIQLWVNLPAKLKMSDPGYQGILNSQIPVVELPGGGGTVRVIAGEYAGARGPTRTLNPMNVWDVSLRAGQKWSFKVRPEDTTAFVLRHGELAMPNGEAVHDLTLALCDRKGDQFTVQAKKDTTLLLLNGEPLDEPIVGYGPFVMNTEAEIRQAFVDYRSGKMGHLS